MKDKQVVKSYTLAGSDFVKPPKPKEQAISLLFGQPGHGKSTLGLSGSPDPIAYFDIDKRGRYALHAALKKKKIVHYLGLDIPRKILKMDDKQLKMAAEKQVSIIRKNMEICVRENEKGNIRTIVFDTATEWCSLVNMAVTGRADRKKDDYGKSTDIVKTAIADIIRMVREDSEANFIMLARAKELWIDNKPTGKYTYRGLDTLDFEADWSGHIRLKKEKGRKIRNTQDHELEITKAGNDLTQLGEVYQQEEWEDEAFGYSPFVFACVQNFPDTEAEDWM